jgi:hypothetical protein
MPKQQTKPENEFNKEEWLRLVKERIMKEPWGSGRLWTDGVITVEVVRVGETEDVMLRIRTPKMGNAVKLTRREHVDSLMELAEAISKNEKNIRDKLEAVREMLRNRARAEEEEL